MDKIKFDKNLATKLSSIMHYNKAKTYCYASDFIKAFPICTLDEFNEGISYASMYVSDYIKDSSNFFSYNPEDKTTILSIEGLFYALCFAQDNHITPLFDQIYNQVYALLPRTAFEIRIRARNLYIEENNKMASNISRRFPNRAEAQRVIRQFNTEIVNNYYGETIDGVMMWKGIYNIATTKKPTYLDYITAKELIDLYYIKKQCNMLLEDNSNRFWDCLDLTKQFSAQMRNKYYTKHGVYPINEKAEEIKVSKLKTKIKDDIFTSYKGKLEFDNSDDAVYYGTLKRSLKTGNLDSFNVLNK